MKVEIKLIRGLSNIVIEIINRVMQMKSKIGDLLDERGLKRTYIAKKLGVTKEMVSRYCAGTSYPRLDKAFELAKILGVKVDDMYEETTSDSSG